MNPNKSRAVTIFVAALLFCVVVGLWMFYGNTGTLTITGQPFDRVEGTPTLTCVTPPCSQHLAPGLYRYTFYKTNYRPLTKDVLIARRQPAVLDLRFQPLPELAPSRLNWPTALSASGSHLAGYTGQALPTDWTEVFLSSDGTGLVGIKDDETVILERTLWPTRPTQARWGEKQWFFLPPATPTAKTTLWAWTVGTTTARPVISWYQRQIFDFWPVTSQSLAVHTSSGWTLVDLATSQESPLTLPWETVRAAQDNYYLFQLSATEWGLYSATTNASQTWSWPPQALAALAPGGHVFYWDPDEQTIKHRFPDGAEEIVLSFSGDPIALQHLEYAPRTHQLLFLSQGQLFTITEVPIADEITKN